VMISIQTPAPDLNSAHTSAAKITTQGHNCQAVLAGQIPRCRRSWLISEAVALSGTVRFRTGPGALSEKQLSRLSDAE